MSSIVITTESFGTLTLSVPNVLGEIQTSVISPAAATISMDLATPGPKGDKGDTGSQGPAGQTGAQGVPGVGVPTGGTTGQVLRKSSGADYATEWGTVSGGAWGTITGSLSAQTDLQNALDAKLGTSTAASTYYPLTNPSGYLTSSALSGYATQSWVTSQGYITSSALSPYLTSSAAASTYQTLAGMSSYLTTSAAASTYAPLASPSLSGTPLAPTATTGTNSTQIATTAFVQSAIIAGSAHAETLQATVRNATGSTLAPFTVVYINGAIGNKASVAKAQANAEATSSGTYAVTESSIANNADGNVIAAGVLSNVDTSAFVDGDKLYLSPSVAGGVTTTKPSAPNHLVYVGVVTRSHPNQGTVSVRIQNGYELDELHNVSAQTPSNLDLLAYDSATSLWKNQTFSALGLETSAHASSTYYLASNPSSFITASALSPYLTSATAASTYQTITEMSSYLTTATAASTYQTQAGMSSYLTTATAASTYAPKAGPTFTGTVTIPTPISSDNSTTAASTAFVKAQGYLTSAPVTSVAGRTGAVTLSTTDISGISSYASLASPTFTGTVTIPAGASISGYATTSSLSSYAPLASPALTGTPTAPTATAGTNTTQIATTAFVASAVSAGSGAVWGSITGTLSSQTDLQTALNAKLNSTTAATTYAPLASPTFTGTVTIPAGASISGYLTSATAASTYAPLASPTFTGTVTIPAGASISGYLTIATAASTYAPLASPTFSGTPSLPTGTTAVTQTAGNNTTALATTAFVQASTVAKVWVNFNGTGTPAIRASYNVSSLTDNGVGNWRINFTNALADANFSTVGSVSNDASSAMGFQPTTRATTSVTVLARDTSSGANVDLSAISVAVFR